MHTMGKRFTALAAALLILLASAVQLAPAEGYSAPSGKSVTTESVSSTKAPASITITSITITGSGYVAKGKKIQLKAAVQPKGASQGVKWVSSNPKIAAVNSKGVVTGKKAGTVKITAVSKANKKVKKTFTVRVMSKAVTKVKIARTDTDVDLAGAKSKKVRLSVKASPSSAAQSFQYASSNTKVATVSKSGVVKFVKPGKVKITVTATDGSKKKASVTFRVTDSSAVPANPPQILTQPQSVSAVPGQSVTFGIEASGTGLSYQWWYLPAGAEDFIAVAEPSPDAVACVVTAAPELNGCLFCCMVWDPYGQVAQSDFATLTVVTDITVVSQPQDVTLEAGGTASFRFEVTGAGVRYQWYYALPGSSDWTLCEGADSDTITLAWDPSYDGMCLICVATDALGNRKESETAVLSVLPMPELVITQQPQNVSAAPGESATFRIAATGSGVLYQWWQLAPGAQDWAALTELGAENGSYTVTASAELNGSLFCCMVYDQFNQCVQSDSAALTVITDITVVSQPQNVTAAVGETAEFRFDVTGTGLQYQWYYRYPSDADWTLFEGAAASAVAFTVESGHNGVILKCVVTDALGNRKESDPATLTAYFKPVFRALLIGNEAYSPALPGPSADLNILSNLLANAVSDSYSVQVRKDCTAGQILGAIGSAYSGAKDTDISLFYFCGHGLIYNDDPQHPETGSLCGIDDAWVTPAQLAGALSAVPGKVIVILQTCHAGSMIGNDLRQSGETGISAITKAQKNAFRKYKLKKALPNFGELATEKFIVLGACRSNEESLGGSYGTALMMAISEALGCGMTGGAYSGNPPADGNGDKVITLGECWQYVARRAKEIAGGHEQNAVCYGSLDFPMFRMK